MPGSDPDPGLWLCAVGGVSALAFTALVLALGFLGLDGQGGPLGDPGAHRWNETLAYVLMAVVIGGLGVFLLVLTARKRRGGGG